MSELNKIYVGNLPYETDDRDLRDFFKKFGDVEEAIVITDRETGRSRGFGFVTYVNAEDAKSATDEDTIMMDERTLKVNVANARGSGGRSYQRSSGGYGGGRSSGGGSYGGRFGGGRDRGYQQRSYYD